MSTIKIEDIAHVRFSAPDLKEMRRFLDEFGLRVLPAESSGLYARGAGNAPFIHATTVGPPAFKALGFRAGSVKDLEHLAKSENLTLHESSDPGGGWIVRMSDPDGHMIEVVAGQALSKPVTLKEVAPRNSAYGYPRLRSSVRIPQGPATVVRLGHAVLNVSNFRASEKWYKDRFGFITSDEVEIEPGVSIGAFFRCDRGAMPTDHHTLFLIQSPDAPGFNHAAFEVADFDDLMRGHAYLKSAQRTPSWGIGRHLLGSQIFDYWKDPWGHELEHWTDGDLFAASDGSNKVGIPELLGVQWGPLHPMIAEQLGEDN